MKKWYLSNFTKLIMSLLCHKYLLIATYGVLSFVLFTKANHLIINQTVKAKFSLLETRANFYLIQMKIRFMYLFFSTTSVTPAVYIR